MNVKIFKNDIFFKLFCVVLWDLIVAIFGGSHSFAQEYPSKPIVIVSAHATGGAADTLSRK
jgi:tripartite-type tricarboxylate transporter receptor subunit TctC